MALESRAGRVYDTEELLDAADYLRDMDDRLPHMAAELEAMKAAADTERTTALSEALQRVFREFGATNAESFYALAFHSYRLMQRSGDPLVTWLSFEHTVEMLGLEADKQRRQAQGVPPCGS